MIIAELSEEKEFINSNGYYGMPWRQNLHGRHICTTAYFCLHVQHLKIKKLIYFSEMKIYLHPPTICISLPMFPLHCEWTLWQEHRIKWKTAGHLKAVEHVPVNWFRLMTYCKFVTLSQAPAQSVLPPPPRPQAAPARPSKEVRGGMSTREGRLTARNAPDNHQVFIGNLPNGVKDDDVRNVFSSE